jgi:SAM-dependent methyltransferase
MKHTACPNCSHTDIYEFHELKNAPTQSLVTIKDYQEAINIPRKNINLGFCQNCGFIFNTTFDTTIDYYTKGYEDQQGFSPTFKKFISEITERVLNRYDIHNKDVIEIGCGKGDFISLVCELGNNRGIGIDPAFVPGRTKPNPNLSFISEFYSEKHGALPADCICCRHTLEHIHGTNEFLKTIRNSIGNRKDVILFFEIPDITRILKIQAFWDIFYEHCTYMSPLSLGNLFRANRFEVLDMYVEYDSQYLFIEAKPVDEISTKKHPLELSIPEMKGLIEEFKSKIGITLDSWTKRLTEFKEKGLKTVVWGGGSKSVGFLTNFDHIGAIDHIVDINPHMLGNYIPGIGKQYASPEFLKEYKPDVVIIMNGVYKKEIGEMLNNMGLNPEIIPL